jgi:hypothetical protein
MAINGGNPDPVDNSTKDQKRVCPFCGEEQWSIPDHIRSGGCDKAPGGA